MEPNQTPVQTPPPAPMPASAPMAAAPIAVVPSVVYAGFWKRFLAILCDSIVLGAIMFAIGFVVVILVPHGFAAQALLAILFLLAWLLYPALMESSKHQATVGKMLVGIKVTSMNGGRISFARALGRNAGKVVSQTILFIGYLMAAFTEKKQALHDIMAQTLVVTVKPISAGRVILVLFAPFIVGALVMFLLGAYISSAIFGALAFPGMTQHMPSDDSSLFVPDSSSGTPLSGDGTSPDQTSSDTAPSAPTVPAGALPAGFDTGKTGPETSAGPALLQVDDDGFFSNSFWIEVYMPNLADFTSSDTNNAHITVSHVYDMTGKDVYDPTSTFETGDFFTAVNFSEDTEGALTYYDGTRTVNLKDGTTIDPTTLASVSGTLSLSYTDVNGKAVTGSYPFTITAPKK